MSDEEFEKWINKLSNSYGYVANSQAAGLVAIVAHASRDLMLEELKEKDSLIVELFDSLKFIKFNTLSQRKANLETRMSVIDITASKALEKVGNNG